MQPSRTDFCSKKNLKLLLCLSFSFNTAVKFGVKDTTLMTRESLQLPQGFSPSLHLSLRTPTSPTASVPSPGPSATHLVPLGPDLIHSDGTIGVAWADPDAVALDHLLHLVLDGQDGLPLAVGLGQCGLELLMGSDQALSQRQAEKTWLTSEWILQVCSSLWHAHK